MSESFSYSFDEEGYFGQFESRAAAFAAALNDSDGYEYVWIGVNIAPPTPWSLIDAENLIVWIQEHEEYECDWASYWPELAPDKTHEQAEKALQQLLQCWFEEHYTPVRHWMVHDSESYLLVAGGGPAA